MRFQPFIPVLLHGTAYASMYDKVSAAEVSSEPSIEEARPTASWAVRNLKTIQTIYNLTVYPNSLPILHHGSAAVPPGLFNENATGRISPVGNFTGLEDSIEYFFALAPVPNGANGSAYYQADVVSFTSGCPNIASSVVYLRTGTVNNVTAQLDLSKPTTTLSQVAFWRFDDEGRVLQYDAWIPNLAAWFNSVQLGNFSQSRATRMAPVDLCPVIQERCTGPNQQYDTVVDCITTLEDKPYGSYDEVWGDNLVCRTIHLILTQVRPAVHCPHVGPVGGNAPNNYKCTSIDYSLEYFDDSLLFGDPHPFMCD